MANTFYIRLVVPIRCFNNYIMEITFQKVKKGVKLYTKQLLWPILHFYDTTFKKELICSVADLMLLRNGEIYNRQFYVASRLLDAKLYYEKGDSSFPYQIGVSYNYRPKSYDREKRTQEFIDLLESVKTNGYNQNSHIAIDKDLHLINGTHRIALALYYNIKEIHADCWRRRNIVDKGIENWTASALNPTILKNVLQEFDAIQEQLLQNGQSFIIWISGDNEKDAKELFDGLTPYVKYYKFYKIAAPIKPITIFDKSIKDGYFAQFIPNKTQYKIKGRTYYSLYIKHLEEILTKKINRLQYQQQFYISPNCLNGQEFYTHVSKYAKEL